LFRILEFIFSSEENKALQSTMAAYPDEFYCPISYTIMKDPVVDREGNTYERESIEKWLFNNETSPITRNTLKLQHLVPNRSLSRLIETYIEQENKREKKRKQEERQRMILADAAFAKSLQEQENRLGVENYSNNSDSKPSAPPIQQQQTTSSSLKQQQITSSSLHQQQAITSLLQQQLQASMTGQLIRVTIPAGATIGGVLRVNVPNIGLRDVIVPNVLANSQVDYMVERPKTKTVQAQIPVNSKPGDVITIRLPGTSECVQVTIPWNSKSNGTLQFDVASTQIPPPVHPVVEKGPLHSLRSAITYIKY
jgi:hypothetical protein